MDGAIHSKGCPEILNECRAIIARQGSCKTGDAVITTAGRLPAKYVIHTVGPVWQGGELGEPALLASCYYQSLQLASDRLCCSVAFPNISTGVYHYPKPQAAKIGIDSVISFLSSHQLPEKVLLVCYDEENYRLYLDCLKDVHLDD